ncbi:primosomal protein N', partial [Candidatus Peregrinibacteria bacterium]|nr:primosomal protein N' [Candidatus Peregrinibacteria bacterium]
MIAQIIPIKRLPRRFSYFDYLVPKELVEIIEPGQLVRIPLKSSEIFGLVLTLREKQESDTSALKEITNIVHETPALSRLHLKTLNTLSSWYGVATGTLAKMMLLPLQKRKLKSISFTNIQEIKFTSPKNNKPTFRLYKDEQEHKHLLTSKLDNLQTDQTLILVPEIHHIDEVLSLMDKHSEHITTWHSGLSTKEQFERWLQIRNGEKQIIIGTRGAILLPFFNLKNIIIDYEHKSNHKHWDQAPRFHVKDVAELLRRMQGVSVMLMSYSVSVESYFNIHKKNYTSKEMQLASLPTCKLVNLSNEHRGGNYSPISDTLEQALLSLEGNAFLYINRLGLATYIGCNECGWRAICTSCKLPQILHTKNKQLTCHYCKTTDKLPVMCPKCKADVVTIGGVGTETVENHVREFVEKNKLPHDVIRIDSQNNTQISKLASKQIILIGTDAAFPQIQWQRTDLIVLLDIDKQLAIPEFRAGEELWHVIQDINYYKQDDAQLIIQTRDPKHLVPRAMNEPDRFYRTDLNHRMKLGYPPYKYLVRYFYGHADFLEAKTVMETSVDVLNNRLKETKQNIELSPAFEMHPRY